MHLVDQPYFFPGACFKCNGNTGPLIDCLTETPQGERKYVCVQCVKDMARFIGGGGPEEIAAANEADERFEQLRAAYDELRCEHAELLANVTATLDAGATVDQRNNRFKLRKHLGKVEPVASKVES